MKSENIDSLYQKYPNLFTEKCEISCGDGWFTIIDTLCAKISFYLKKNPEITYTPKQIKEKFGELRFYGLGGDKPIHSMVYLTERLSNKVCEECGAPGERRQTSWLYTYTSCEEHKINEDEE